MVNKMVFANIDVHISLKRKGKYIGLYERMKIRQIIANIAEKTTKTLVKPKWPARNKDSTLSINRKKQPSLNQRWLRGPAYCIFRCLVGKG